MHKTECLCAVSQWRQFVFRKLFSKYCLPESLCKSLFFTWLGFSSIFLVYYLNMNTREHQRVFLMFCFAFFREKKSVSGLVQVWSGQDLWLKWTAKGYFLFFFVASPLQRTWAVLLPHSLFSSPPEGHLQLSPPPMLFPHGLGVAQGTSGVLWGCCAGAWAQLQVWGQSRSPSHWCVCSPLQPRAEAAVSSAGHRAGCINIFMLFYSQKKQNYDVLKLLIYCSWLLHYFCVINQKTILGSPILLLLMSRKKIPIYSSGTETGRSRCWKKNHLKIISKRERICRRDYRINLPHLIRYVTQKIPEIEEAF